VERGARYLEVEVLDVAALRDVLHVGDVEEAVAAKINQLQLRRALDRRRHLRFIPAISSNMRSKCQICYLNTKYLMYKFVPTEDWNLASREKTRAGCV